jgi:hypothetical protein
MVTPPCSALARDLLLPPLQLTRFFVVLVLRILPSALAAARPAQHHPASDADPEDIEPALAEVEQVRVEQ